MRALTGMAMVAALSVAAQNFEALGIPVVKAGLMGCIVGPGPAEGSERIYFNFRQDGGKLFLVAVDPATGAAEQFNSPAGTGAWGFMVGPDQKIYLGTHEGPDPGDSGQILVFDPKDPGQGIRAVGRPAESETYLWMFTLGPDGKIYGCTYPNAKLVSYDPATGAMTDHGVMDPTQKYTRSICTGPDGHIYIGVGYGKANVIVFDPGTGEHKSILPEEYRAYPEQTVASVYTGEDGAVYVQAIKVSVLNGDPENGEIKKNESVTLRVDGDKLTETASPAPPVNPRKLSDGHIVQNPKLGGTYELLAPDGSVEQRSFTYQGAGAGIFMVANGPLGRVYGSSYMPCELFWYDPATGAMENPGNPVEVGGEIYSMLDHHGAYYLCAYPGSFLSKWDPAKPWNYGREPENNPRGFGPLGVGHLRPRAMIHGPGEMIYIGSYPEYGRLGGSMGVWDPAQDKLIENYHHLIKNQSIVALVYDEETRLVFGASSVVGGGGTSPSEPEAKFFAFDSAPKKLVIEMAPVPGAQAIRSLALAGRTIFGVADEDTLFVYEIGRNETVHTAKLGVGEVLDLSLRLWKDGMLYGLSKKRVFRLDPGSYTVEILAEYPGEIRCGFAMDDRGIYFGDRATLMRYNWPK